ncbi:hypothetical protein AB0D08_17700 [Kitasatospora sp. NPDC048540]|uniref:hypothetical protein n=1 Tax=Kitasatospora sp. NPDC048540 TaxID=3155634 RepID=UPI0033FD7070
MIALTTAGTSLAATASNADAAQVPSNSQSCKPVSLWANTGDHGARLLEFNPATGAKLRDVPLTRVYGDIAFSSDGKTLYGADWASPSVLATIDPRTGQEISTIPITGPAGAVGIISLTALPNGLLLAGSGTTTVWTIDPRTGASAAYADFPAGFSASGDLMVLGDGDVISLRRSATDPTALFRLHPDRTTTELGSLPASYGLAQSAGRTYSFTADGRILRLNPVPRNSSTQPLGFTEVKNTGDQFFGATSTQSAGSCDDGRRPLGSALFDLIHKIFSWIF